jgi:hypothetical protein
MFAAQRLSLENVEHPGAWVALGAAGAAVLAWSYWGIFRRSERSLTWALMLLRGAGLVALFLALAKPTWTSESRLTDAGRVGIVLDNSLSMSLPHAAGKSRYALAKEAVAVLHDALQTDRSGPRPEIDLADIQGAALRLTEIPEQPTVVRTDLGRALTETRDRLRSKLLTGLVLISDGMDNTGRQDFGELADLGVPVFTLGFRPDADGASLDLAVGAPRAPARAMVHNTVRVEVPVSKTGGPATEATVSVKLGGETFASKRVSIGPGNGEQVVALEFAPAKPGSFVFTASVDADTGERVLSNNSTHFPLRVDRAPIRVLYLDGFLRYEYKFLKTQLEDDPDVSLVSVVRRVNPGRAEPRTGPDLIAPERLKDVDVVILGDMEAGYLSGAGYRALVKWLDAKGHALLVLGGYRSFGPDGFRLTPLAEVLPVNFAERPPFQSEKPFGLELTEAGRRHPVFEVSRDRTRDAEAWAKSPLLAGSSLVERAKPGAEVLAVNPGVRVDGKPAVVVAVQRYGAGYTMVLTADTTWRWSRLPRVLGQSDTLYGRFWSQTLRWLAGRSLDDQRPFLSVSTDRPDYELDKPGRRKVTIMVVRQPRPGIDPSVAEVSVQVARAGGPPTAVDVRAGSATPDAFTGTFFPAADGRYEVTATLTEKGQLVANAAGEFLVLGPDLELADPRTNRANLQALAVATGGVYLDVEDAARLADKIPRKERQLAQVRRLEMWNSPILFLCFLAALTAEWLIRRRNHLV